MEASCSDPSQRVDMVLANSIIRDVYRSVRRYEWGGSTVDTTIAYSDLVMAKILEDFGGGNGTITFGSGNLDDVDPLFVDANDAHLQADSPVIGAGDPAAPPAWMKDLDGNARVSGGRRDMGAYEFQVPGGGGGGGGGGAGGGGAPAPPDGGKTPPPSTSPDGPDDAGPLTPGVPTRAELLAALRGGMKAGALTPRTVYRFTWPAAGTISVVWRAKAPARSSAVSARSIVVARGSRTRSAAGVGTVRMGLTAAGKKLLRQRKKTAVTVRTTFTAPGVTPVMTTARRTVRAA
jgi:hypothetical protein